MKEVKGYNPSKDPRLLNCKTECGNEMCFAKRYGLFAERTCPNFTESKLQTNADRIRSMTDEELAHFMARVCPPGGECNGDGNCFACRRDWLKSPVQPGEADNADN